MGGKKPWYQSRTVWAGLVAMLAGVAGAFDIAVGQDLQTDIVDLLISGAAVVGGAGSIWGRLRAKLEIESGGSDVLSSMLVGGLLLGAVAVPDAHAQSLGHLEWDRPTERENGDALPVEEIGGYEIRYQYEGEQYVVIVPDGEAVGYDLSGLDPSPGGAGSVSFEIAVYDTEGLYSDFVPIDAVVPANPGPLQARYIAPPGYDPTEGCIEDDYCRTDMMSAIYPPED